MNYFVKFISLIFITSLIFVGCDDDSQSASTFSTYTLSSVAWYSNADCSGEGFSGSCHAADSTNFYGYFCMIDTLTYEYVSEDDCANISIVDSVDTTDDSCVWETIMDQEFEDQATPAITIHDGGTIDANWGDDIATGTWAESGGAIMVILNFLAEEYTDADGNGAFDEGEEFIDINGNSQWDDASTETMVFTQNGTTLISQISDPDNEVCAEYLFTLD